MNKIVFHIDANASNTDLAVRMAQLMTTLSPTVPTVETPSSDVHKELQEMKAEINKLQNKVDELEGKNEDLSCELDGERNAHEEYSDKVTKDINNYKKEIKSLKKSNTELMHLKAKAVADLKEEIEALKKDKEDALKKDKGEIKSAFTNIPHNPNYSTTEKVNIAEGHESFIDDPIDEDKETFKGMLKLIDFDDPDLKNYYDYIVTECEIAVPLSFKENDKFLDEELNRYDNPNSFKTAVTRGHEIFNKYIVNLCKKLAELATDKDLGMEKQPDTVTKLDVVMNDIKHSLKYDFKSKVNEIEVITKVVKQLLQNIEHFKSKLDEIFKPKVPPQIAKAELTADELYTMIMEAQEKDAILYERIGQYSSEIMQEENCKEFHELSKEGLKKVGEELHKLIGQSKLKSS